MYEPHTLVTFGGQLDETVANDEIWQCGVRGFTDGGVPVPAASLHDVALSILRGPTGAGAGLEGIWGDVRSHLANTATLKWCKAVNIGPDGKYTSEPGIAEMTPVPGPATALAPSFCSIAISWETGFSLGKAVRGRIYLPNYGAALSIGSKIQDSVAADILAWSTVLLNTLDTSLEAVPFHPNVVSKSGVHHQVTGSRVGNVYDTQRRRKDAVAETYISAGWTP